MRKTELPNCPQWLLDANTENEDVYFNDYGVLIWRGGNFWGGDFLGGNFLGGNFWGEKISRAPISIFGLKNWPVQITPTKMHIGCQHHDHSSWRNFTDQEINNMAIGAGEFWRVNKAFLLSICDYEASLDNQGE